MIDRRSNLSYEEFRRDHLLPRRPVVVTDVTNHWAARQWTPAHLRDRYGSRVLETDANQMPVKVLSELQPELEPLPPYCQPNWLELPWPSLFSRGYASNMNRLAQMEIHCTATGQTALGRLRQDPFGAHALLFQLVGDRDFSLYAPGESPYLYGEHGVSAIEDLERADPGRFPLFARARGVTLKLRAGETLFLPCGWWSAARAPAASIAVELGFANESNWRDMIDKMVRAELRTAPLFLPYASFLTGYWVVHQALGKLGAVRRTQRT